MEAKDAPEKIYLDIKGFENSDLSFSEIRSRFGIPYYEHPVSNIDIEYTRTDAFMEKACEWLSGLRDLYVIRNFYTGESYPKEKLIDDFRKAMEE